MIEIEVFDADQTREVGRVLASYLRAGDLVMLSGDLGAGKTTFTQGIGAGLQVRGSVASPTFIVARVHPPLSEGGVPLIHADAYRIDSLDDLETLDLDSSLGEAVTVVEWGEGKIEGLSQSRLQIRVERPHGQAPDAAFDGVIDLEGLDDGKRRLIIEAIGPRWEGVEFAFPHFSPDRDGALGESGFAGTSDSDSAKAFGESGSAESDTSSVGGSGSVETVNVDDE